MSDKLKGVWLDGSLWECEELSLLEKHFLQKIKDLDNENGCFANNAFFSDFFGISKGRCTQVINKLEEKGMLSKKLEKKGVLVTRRVLRILNKGVKLFKHGGVKDSKLGVYFSKQEVFKKLKDSNTIKLKNIIKNLEEREKHAHKENLELKAKIKTLESELNLNTKKETEEKSCAKKEEITPPPTAEQLNAKTETVPQYKITLHDYPFKNWTDQLKTNFLTYCQMRHEKAEAKGFTYGFTQTKENVSEVESMIFQYSSDIGEAAVKMATKGGWIQFFPDRIKNDIERLYNIIPANFRILSKNEPTRLLREVQKYYDKRDKGLDHTISSINK